MDKLAKLAPSGIIEKIQNLGVIAGGSVVYALNDFVPKNSVSDIDVFVNSVDELKQIVSLLNVEEMNVISTNEPSILNVKTFETIFQIIIHPFKNPIEIINSFDLDYVQCGFYHGKLLISERAILAHKNREIKFISTLRVGKKRFLKALNKGFKTPVFGIPKNEIIYQKIENIDEIKFGSFGRTQYPDDEEDRTVWYDLTTAKCIEINKYWFRFSILNEAGELCFFDSYYMSIKINVNNISKNLEIFDYLYEETSLSFLPKDIFNIIKSYLDTYNCYSDNPIISRVSNCNGISFLGEHSMIVRNSKSKTRKNGIIFVQHIDSEFIQYPKIDYSFIHQSEFKYLSDNVKIEFIRKKSDFFINKTLNHSNSIRLGAVLRFLDEIDSGKTYEQASELSIDQYLYDLNKIFTVYPKSDNFLDIVNKLFFDYF